MRWGEMRGLKYGDGVSSGLGMGWSLVGDGKVMGLTVLTGSMFGELSTMTFQSASVKMKMFVVVSSYTYA